MRDGALRSNVVSSQYFHAEHGGVVPELASRAHLTAILPIVREALGEAAVTVQELDAVAATQGPGLIGSLLVGLNLGKALAVGLGIPFLPVNHIEAHLFSTFLQDPHPSFPFLALAVSGGHTLLVRIDDVGAYTLLGGTIDDAAGEAFDKVGKMLGLGFPGGPAIDRLAVEGNPDALAFPRPLLDSGDDRFSFSGLKTSVLYHLRGRARNGVLELHANEIADICASFQRAVVDVLAGKLLRAAHREGIRDIAVVGGVSANRELQLRLRHEAEQRGLRVFIPDLLLSTDNAAMVARLAALKLERHAHGTLDAPAFARLGTTLFSTDNVGR
ncbi:MAG: tRNA (adenosine(37)-N6)-threonylcarbamoyltransferase complex transferase subunit TsaD [Bacteroidetes bacterium]|nr:tRNA (adenosine(37)-N6)-threonylcarbamoyltransferase complex transferase subunit TsaD [Bacteroidota bacterium]